MIPIMEVRLQIIIIIKLIRGMVIKADAVRVMARAAATDTIMEDMDTISIKKTKDFLKMLDRRT